MIVPWLTILGALSGKCSLILSIYSAMSGKMFYIKSKPLKSFLWIRSGVDLIVQTSYNRTFLKSNEVFYMPKSEKIEPLTPGGLIIAGAIAAPFGALFGGVEGVLGRYGLSFFNPVMASAAGTFGTFAAMGAIAAPLLIIPKLLTDHFLNKSSFLNQHPNLKGFLADTNALLLSLAATATAALILGLPPLGATVISMMIIPAALYALSTLCRFINICLNLEAEEDRPAPFAASV